jgi:DNA-binding NarL/FixJ family response regulator
VAGEDEFSSLPYLFSLISLFFLFRGVAMLRILVADDVPMVRAGLKLLLETHEGWSVCGEAGDGEDAVQKAFALNPDVVLLDVAMPNLNGIDAAEIIKKYLPSATIYFVTQYDSLEMARATAEVGARGYIAKVHIPTDLVPANRSGCRLPAR